MLKSVKRKIFNDFLNLFPIDELKDDDGDLMKEDTKHFIKRSNDYFTLVVHDGQNLYSEVVENVMELTQDGGEIDAPPKEVLSKSIMPTENKKVEPCCNLMVLIEFLLEYIALFDFITDLIITI
jgi:hypothetical protein